MKIKNLKLKIKSRYFPQEIESKWQEIWDKTGLYKFSSKHGKKYYNLVELPYPSGDLHIGHWFSFVPPDVHARYKRMAGFDVFFPNGFDAFGLPAENAAIKRGVHPKDWTMKNVATMTKQFATMGTMIDWDYTAITCLPEYYKWNQWIFLKMFERGLAYRGKALSNWCEVDKTVLANEHIEAGKCWRCGAEVIQKEVEQWFLRITEYADRLIWPQMEETGGQPHADRDARSSFPQNQSQTSSLSESQLSNSEDNPSGQEPSFGSLADGLSSGKDHQPARNASASVAGGSSIINHKSFVDWPKQVIDGQNNWIGRSEGVLIQFPISNSQFSIEVFTTHPETADGATFLVVAPEHEFVSSLLNGKWQMANGKLKEIQEYVEQAKKKTEMERKEDRTKSGIFTSKYVKNPVTGKDIPVWISDYVLAGYGTGAIMAVPSADQRDREFATKFQLPIEKTSFKAKPENAIAKVNYHLRDWSISRQRYWGTPIPVIHCRECWEVKSQKSPARNASASVAGGKVKSKQGSDYSIIDGKEYAMIPVPLEDLPIELPYNVDYTPKGKPPLASDEEWLSVKCPKCGGKAKRDAETLDTFFDSAWYFYRYVSPNYDKAPFDQEKVKQLLPVDVYFGGSEHTLGHTLYARFFTKVFKDMGLIDFDEFADKRVQHGVVLGPDGNRMSKSKGNVVSPDDVVKEYGADAVRLYLCFMMPYEATAPWSVGAINGIYRFLKRVWELQDKIKNQKSKIKDELSREDYSQMHKAIKKVGDDLNNFQFNTAVAALMTWLNFLSAKDKIAKEEYETFLKLLAPFAPHLTEEIWQTINSSANSIHLENWPVYQANHLVEENTQIVVAVNGKTRATILVPTDKIEEQSEVEKLAKDNQSVVKYINNMQVKKVVYVKARIINFVVG
nr:leucine--tRNA ligase [Candidatus Levybacteria bacterium]